jgi:hypothetical protein
LLVEIRRLDLGDHVTGLDLGADIGAPALEIAADARKDRRARIGFQPARQIDGRIQRAGAGRRDGYRRDRLGVGPFLQPGAGILAGTNAGGDDQPRTDHGH